MSITRVISVSLLVLASSPAFAQSIALESIQDSVIGWMKAYHFKGVKDPVKVDDKFYTAAQLSIADSLANWMRASYVPKGGLGELKKAVTEKLGLYNQHTAGKPQSYGAYSKTYYELKYDNNKKMVPMTNSHVYWGIFANKVPGDWPVRDICTPTTYYFTIPSLDPERTDARIKKQLDLSTVPGIAPYTTFWVENMGYGQGQEHVLLCKDNKSPFINITRGEYLQAWEAAIPGFYEAEKKKIYEKEQGIQKRIDNEMKLLDERIQRFRKGLQANKEKYKNKLGEPAMTTAQPSIVNLENGRDVFTGSEMNDGGVITGLVPVYKVDPVVAALCKSDKPQWILVSWDYYPTTQPTQNQQHDAIVNNFNFTYVYNFFFYPEKVKGQPYKPLRSPTYKEAVEIREASAASRKNHADASIHFFDDFSTTAMGKQPLGWKTKMGSNGTSTVTNLEGLEGNWVIMNGRSMTPGHLVRPLPRNFTLSYELVAAQNFTWGARGMTFQLSKETSPGNAESYIKLKLRPGFDGRGGEAEVETKFPSGYSSGTKWLEAPGFSNNRINNHITVSIVKKEERLQILIDNNEIVEYEKAIPAALLFNAMSFYPGENMGEHDKYYISNIKITKD